jgi:hypothetical protein
MRRWVLLAVLLAGGCMPPRGRESPLWARGSPFDTDNQTQFLTDNPGGEAYALLFEKILDVLDDDFEIAYANRYDGRIETTPRVAAGLEQPWKAGSPSVFDRLLYSCQTYRHRAFVLVQPIDKGYSVNVTVFKELEDLPQPTRELGGGAAFRADQDIDRQYQVVDPTVVSHVWIPKGRDVPLEQKIIRKLRWKLMRGGGD